MVLEQPTMAKRRRALATLPSQLNDAYGHMVDQIQNSGTLSDLGMRVLMWLHLAKRPLKVAELQHGLAVERGDNALDEEAIPAQKRLLDCCLGLVLVDEETLTIRLVHYTLEEYFRKHSSTIFPQGHSTAAEICLTYLNFSELSVECKTNVDMKQQLQKFPFLEYASFNWGYYTALAQGHSDVDIEGLRALAMKVLLGKSKQPPHIALQLLYTRKSYSRHYKCSQYFLGVHAAAYFGLEAHMSMPGNDQGWDVQDADGQTPLVHAAFEGHEAVVRLLVERGEVDADSKDNDGRTPLSRAASAGHEAVVRLLVEREDVDAESRDNHGWTPLAHAASAGHGAVVRLLVERGDVDADSKDNSSWTPLSRAASAGHEAVVRLLVEREDVDAESRDNHGWTLLAYAASAGHGAVVRLLVERGDVDAGSKDNDGGTPLSWAAFNGHEAVVRLLVDRRDVDADSKDNDGGTPLSRAASAGHEAIVRLLVERGDVDAASQDESGRTPLSLAELGGHTSCAAPAWASRLM